MCRLIDRTRRLPVQILNSTDGEGPGTGRRVDVEVNLVLVRTFERAKVGIRICGRESQHEGPGPQVG